MILRTLRNNYTHLLASSLDLVGEKTDSPEADQMETSANKLYFLTFLLILQEAATAHAVSFVNYYTKHRSRNWCRALFLNELL